jgi:hypothetical protein
MATARMLPETEELGRKALASSSFKPVPLREAVAWMFRDHEDLEK